MNSFHFSVAALIGAIFSFLPRTCAAAEHPLDALFAGRAHFEEVRTIDFTALNHGIFEGNTASLAIHDGKWFAFNRRVVKSATCGEAYEVAVRQSADQGQTWSDAVVLGGPTTVNPCGIVDGGAYFDSTTQSWHFLAQCLLNGRWNVCHFTRHDPSPMGTFTADPANPVVTPSKIFSQMPGASGFFDEGTPEILYKIGDFFYVTFHGYNGKNGIRGAARTKDFNTWEATGPGLPGRPMFTAADCQPWNLNWKGGCIGGGHASTLVTPAYHYMLIEAADMNLSCTAGQNWVLGLMRAPQLAASGNWQSYGSNPVVQNLGVESGCAIQYHHLFADGPTVFVYFGYADSGRPYPNKLFKVVAGPGPKQIVIDGTKAWLNLPKGSYRLSCYDCSLTANLLQCSCRNKQSDIIRTQLDISHCDPAGELGNIDGSLTCNPR